MSPARPGRETPSERHAAEVASNRRLWDEWTGIHERLAEYPFLNWSQPYLVPDGEGRYRLPPDSPGELPLMFSVLASKPA